MEINQEDALKRGRREILMDRLRANESALGPLVSDMTDFLRTLVHEPPVGWQAVLWEHAKRVAQGTTERAAILEEMRR